ncbi:hypothetical protein AAVH_39333 [Aphelenchoides avenae]|nr:hypothetical protein AAVH_39333 [Aphelenchus avenae]
MCSTLARHGTPKTPAKGLADALLTPRRALSQVKNKNAFQTPTNTKSAIALKQRAYTVHKSHHQSIDFNRNDDDFDFDDLSLCSGKKVDEKNESEPKEESELKEDSTVPITTTAAEEETDHFDDDPDEIEPCTYMWGYGDRDLEVQDLIESMPWYKSDHPILEEDFEPPEDVDYSLRGLLSEEEMAAIERGEKLYPAHLDIEPADLLKRLYWLKHGDEEEDGPDPWANMPSSGLFDGLDGFSDEEESDDTDESTFVDGSFTSSE